MKLIIMAAALMLGGGAVAQTTDDTAATTATAGQTVAPGNTSPETDARGIPVISAPATAPAGYNQPVQTDPGAMAMTDPSPPTTSAGPLPPCTRTLTDRCTQTYERGRAR